MEVLRQYPPSLAEVLRLDPSLLTSEQYIATYPGLAAFVARHPEVVRNPAYFFGSEHVRSWDDYGPRAEAVRVWRNVIEGAQIFSVFAVITGTHHLAGQDAGGPPPLAAPVEGADRGPHQAARPLHVQRGPARLHPVTGRQEVPRVRAHLARCRRPSRATSARPSAASSGPSRPARCCCSPASGLQFIGQRQQWEEIGQPLSSMGILVVAIGLGFLISAAASYFLSRRLGLLPDYNAKHDVPARHDAL